MTDLPSFDFNPFGGLTPAEVKKMIVPKFDLDEMAEQVNSKVFDAIQFVGNHGRGKTTHLIALHEVFKEAPIHFLTKQDNHFNLGVEELIFIDSIGHLSIPKRIQLWKNKNHRFVFTTHISRNFELNCFGRKLKSYRFSGIDTQAIEEIIRKRLEFIDLKNQDDLFEKIPKLIKRHGGDIRAIMFHMYEALEHNYFRQAALENKP